MINKYEQCIKYFVYKHQTDMQKSEIFKDKNKSKLTSKPPTLNSKTKNEVIPNELKVTLVSPKIRICISTSPEIS